MNRELTNKLQLLTDAYNSISNYQQFIYHIHANQFNVKLQGNYSQKLAEHLLSNGYALTSKATKDHDFNTYTKGDIQVVLDVSQHPELLTTTL